MTVRFVYFDVGETLVDETRMWSEWADWLGVPRPEFLAALAKVIRESRDHREVFSDLGRNFETERARRAETGRNTEVFRAGDLYLDARPSLEALYHGGLRLGIAGNQGAMHEPFLRDQFPWAEIVTSSDALGAAKPSLEFFQRLVALTALSAGEVAYVGDRVDNDIAPAAHAGLQPILVIRGLWAKASIALPARSRAIAQVRSLSELPALLVAP